MKPATATTPHKKHTSKAKIHGTHQQITHKAKHIEGANTCKCIAQCSEEANMHKNEK